VLVTHRTFTNASRVFALRSPLTVRGVCVIGGWFVVIGGMVIAVTAGAGFGFTGVVDETVETFFEPNLVVVAVLAVMSGAGCESVVVATFVVFGNCHGASAALLGTTTGS
jgi:hypothetical protein